MAAVLAGGFYANDSDKRLFLWALAGSLTLHLVLLLGLALLRDVRPVRAPMPSLTAHLAKPAPAEPAPPKIVPPAQAPAPPRPAPAAKPVPQPAPVPALPERVLSVEPAKQAAEPAARVVPVTPVARPPVAPQAQAASGPDPGTVAQFRLELMDLARRYKKYPRIAQDNNWEGRVELRILIGENGAIAALAVGKSTGRAVLDDEAQAMIRSAKSKATIPPALRGKSFTLVIPVDFSLKDEAR
jgi:protein TonB